MQAATKIDTGYLMNLRHETSECVYIDLWKVFTEGERSICLKTKILKTRLSLIL